MTAMQKQRGMVPILLAVIVAANSVIQLEVSTMSTFLPLTENKHTWNNFDGEEGGQSVVIPAAELVPNENSTHRMGKREKDASLQEEQETDNEHQPQTRPRKFYAIHIGPSKTGTTAIQYDLARIQSLEGSSNTFTTDKDNIIYIGRPVGHGKLVDPVFRRIAVQAGTDNKATSIKIRQHSERKSYYYAVKCMRKIMDEEYYNSTEDTEEISVLNERLDSDEGTRNSLKQEFLQRCWVFNYNGTMIDFSYMLNFNMVDSNEEYSYKNGHVHNGQQFRIFDILGYEQLLVVGAYRRYADWLISAYTQSIKAGWLEPNLIGKKLSTPCNPLKNFIDVHMNGRDRDTHRVRSWYDPISVTIPEVLKMGPPKLEAKILNFFQLPRWSSSSSETQSLFPSYNSITTELYCHAFGEELTPHTCRSALNTMNMQAKKSIESSSKHSSLVENKGSLSSSVYQGILASAYRYGFLHLSVEDKSCKKETEIWCDDLSICSKDLIECNNHIKKREAALNRITLNGNKTILGTNPSNITMFQDLSDYHTQVHKKSWTTSLPILCPPKDTLEKLLNKSLALEEVAMPEFYHSPMGREKHIELFWGKWLRDKKIFCWVDILRLFEGVTTWDEIVNERMVTYDWGEPREYIKGKTEELPW